MDGRIEELAAAVAAVSRAAGTALDPTAILSRTMEALAPIVPVVSATLWTGEADDLRLTASYPAGAALDPDHLVVALDGPDRRVGRLALVPEPGHQLSDAEVALLEIAGTQIAGALDRARLFQEVMELERLKSDFISRVSHELRTPITIIRGFLDTMLAHEDSLGPEQRHHMLERSHLASARLSGLIEELLTLSRLDAGVLTPDPSRTLVLDLLASVRDAAIEPDHVLLGAPDGGQLEVDGALLARAIGLVVDNAIKYGGTAEVTAVAPDPGSTVWRFEVRDRGAGFADDVVDTAFEMFTRSQGTTAIPGLGVGLPIARTLVEVLDGSIAIDTTHEGIGALVRIEVPGG